MPDCTLLCCVLSDRNGYSYSTLTLAILSYATFSCATAMYGAFSPSTERKCHFPATEDERFGRNLFKIEITSFQNGVENISILVEYIKVLNRTLRARHPKISCKTWNFSCESSSFFYTLDLSIEDFSFHRQRVQILTKTLGFGAAGTTGANSHRMLHVPQLLTVIHARNPAIVNGEN